MTKYRMFPTLMLSLIQELLLFISINVGITFHFFPNYITIIINWFFYFVLINPAVIDEVLS